MKGLCEEETKSFSGREEWRSFVGKEKGKRFVEKGVWKGIWGKKEWEGFVTSGWFGSGKLTSTESGPVGSSTGGRAEGICCANAAAHSESCWMTQRSWCWRLGLTSPARLLLHLRGGRHKTNIDWIVRALALVADAIHTRLHMKPKTPSIQPQTLNPSPRDIKTHCRPHHIFKLLCRTFPIRRRLSNTRRWRSGRRWRFIATDVAGQKQLDCMRFSIATSRECPPYLQQIITIFQCVQSCRLLQCVNVYKAVQRT